MAQAKETKSKSKRTKEAEITVETAVIDQETPKMEVEVIEQTDSQAPAEDSGDGIVAKAGKRSAKAQKEADQKQEKESRKKLITKVPESTKQQKKPTRSKLERSSKKYREAAKLIEVGKVYALDQALELASKTSTVKFDATVELHMNLGVDPKHADQNIRDTVLLPGGTGKVVRIAVLAEEADAKLAKAAGAAIAGLEDLLSKLDKEEIEFDVLISTPAQMPKLGKYARLLGPRGLMPNPKSGTVTNDIAKAVTEAKAGKVEYRVDQAGIVHLGIGKVSFEPAKLKLNADAVIASIKAAKPSSLKGNYIKSAYITTSMGPSIKVDLS
jgi:ribosomal protein L1